jgi:hypothetical protein
MSGAESARDREPPTDEVARYVRRKRIEYAQQLLPKTKIYLDTKYWISFRDVRLGRSSSPAMTELLERLESLVKSGNAFCALNADVYFEVLKQQDPVTLRESVQLLDDLSTGACLLPMTERIRLEVAHFLESATRGANAVHELRELVWTRPAYIIGFVTPNCFDLSRDLNVEVQRRFADHLFGLSLMDMVTTMGIDQVAERPSPFKDISGPLNQGKLENIDVHKSFKSVFLSEVEGIVDVYSADFADYIRYMHERQSGADPSAESKVDNRPGVLVGNMIREAFRRNRITTQFPTIRIGAGLHAALRWDRKRKYKANDLFDFRHAEAALPYCDYFFTEHSLRNLVQDRNLQFGKHFACKVFSDPGDALQAIGAVGPS